MSVQTINAQMKRRPTDFVVLICFIVMFLSFVCRGTQPIFEMHFAEARIRAGDEALIVYFDAVVERFVVSDYFPRVAGRAQILPNKFVLPDLIGPGHLNQPIYRLPKGY